MPQVKVVDLTRKTGQANIQHLKNGREPVSAVYDDPSLSFEDFPFVRKEVILRTERAEGLKKGVDLENPM
jgi:hypothetical protein